MKQRTVTPTVGARRVTNTRRLNPVHQGAADTAPDEYQGLVRAAAAGEADALNRLLMRAQEVAWRFSTTVCGPGGDAEDAMQEALIKTYRYVGRIREPAAFRPWLYRTVRNACLMGRRKKVGEPTRLQSLDELHPAMTARVRMRRTPERIRNSLRTTSGSGAGSERRLGNYRRRTELSCSCGKWKVCRLGRWHTCWGYRRTTSRPACIEPVSNYSQTWVTAGNDCPDPPVGALPHPVAGVVTLCGRRSDACPASGGRAASRHVPLLRDDGLPLVENDGRLSRRRAEAPAPHRDVARRKASQGTHCPRPRLEACRAQDPRRVSLSRVSAWRGQRECRLDTS